MSEIHASEASSRTYAFLCRIGQRSRHRQQSQSSLVRFIRGFGQRRRQRRYLFSSLQSALTHLLYDSQMLHS